MVGLSVLLPIIGLRLAWPSILTMSTPGVSSGAILCIKALFVDEPLCFFNGRFVVVKAYHGIFLHERVIAITLAAVWLRDIVWHILMGWPATRSTGRGDADWEPEWGRGCCNNPRALLTCRDRGGIPKNWDIESSLPNTTDIS
ncbi:hypothetical protein JB92DRAFT_2826107 [Gautieria morchelliformis]|nr:hypothetical protein JB92DRAFT_2826107 [Gautieria morchelliformis]